jgi:hypothetical protein
MWKFCRDTGIFLWARIQVPQIPLQALSVELAGMEHMSYLMADYPEKTEVLIEKKLPFGSPDLSDHRGISIPGSFNVREPFRGKQRRLLERLSGPPEMYCIERGEEV